MSTPALSPSEEGVRPEVDSLVWTSGSLFLVGDLRGSLCACISHHRSGNIGTSNASALEIWMEMH